MKRYGDLWSQVIDYENLRLAHHNASKGKGFYKEVQEVNENIDYYLTEIQKMLIEKTYRTSEYVIFKKKEKDKERDIYKLPYYPDRIVQWALVQVIEPILMRKMTINTYSAIPGRGIHFGMKRVLKDLKNKEDTQYCLKLDIKKYYPSINHTLLKKKYASVIKDKDVLWLIDEIIDSTDGEKGIPIGNFLSQWSGNFFLSGFDHWIKEEMKVKKYHRYMDDIVILHGSKDYLRALFWKIKEYLNQLDLEVKANWQIFPTYKRGLDFLGYRFFDGYTLLRKSSLKSMKKSLKKMRKKIENDGMLTQTLWCAYNSYRGWLKWCNSYRLSKKYFEPLFEKVIEYYVVNIKKGVFIPSCMIMEW